MKNDNYIVDVSKLIVDCFLDKILVVFDEDKIKDSEECYNILRIAIEIIIELIKSFTETEEGKDVEVDYLERLARCMQKI